MRSGLGSEPECLPKKLSSSAVASEVWLSVEPIMPNLKGFEERAAYVGRALREPTTTAAQMAMIANIVECTGFTGLRKIILSLWPPLPTPG